MSAVSNSVMPRSIALWITLREASRSMRWPKLLQPRPTAETRRPEPPRLRICMEISCETRCARYGRHSAPPGTQPQGAVTADIAHKGETKKVRPRSDAATDGDRFGARDRDGGPDQTQAQPSHALLRSHDSRTYPQGRLRRSDYDSEAHTRRCSEQFAIDDESRMLRDIV